MNNGAKKIITGILSIGIAFILLQTLFFKFTGSAETQHIFSTFQEWADGFGAGFLFSQWGPLGPYLSGLLELVASLLLLIGTFKASLRMLQAVGAALAGLMMMSAVALHLVTPLGVEVMGDGGLLFGLAATALVSSIVILSMRKDLLFGGGGARA